MHTAVLRAIASGVGMLVKFCSRFVRSCGKATSAASKFVLFFYGLIPGAQSLKMKMTVGSGTVAALILVSMYSLLTTSARAATIREAERQAAELVRYCKQTLAESVAAKDRMQIHLLVEALQNDTVHAIIVHSSDGDLLFRGDDSLPLLYPTNAELRNVIASGFEEVAHSGKILLRTTTVIRFGPRPVGIMDLWLDRSRLEAHIESVNAFIYPILVAGFLLMLLLNALVIYTPFRTLKHLTEEARRIGAGDLSGRVPIHGEDEVAEFSEAFNDMVRSLSLSKSESFRKHLQTIKAMISAVEAKDEYTRGHCVRVREYARALLERIGSVSEKDRTEIETAALLHDIGKIGVPDHILLKESSLDALEIRIVRTHVAIGEKILLHLDSMKQIARSVKHHHERWDGLGYPDGLKERGIPFASRVIAVADAIDAMRTNRPYRDSLSRDEAIQALREGSGKQFDPFIVELAIQNITEKEVVHAAQINA